MDRLPFVYFANITVQICSSKQLKTHNSESSQVKLKEISSKIWSYGTVYSNTSYDPKKNINAINSKQS